MVIKGLGTCLGWVNLRVQTSRGTIVHSCFGDRLGTSFVTKLVPSLSPKHECTMVPREVCTLKFTQPRQVPKPLMTKWCLDPTPPSPGQSYDESEALGDVLAGNDLQQYSR